MTAEQFDKLEDISVYQSKVSSLIRLAAYMMGQYNGNEGKVIDNEQLNSKYPIWIEHLLDSLVDLSNLYKDQLDDVIVDEMKARHSK